MRYAQLSLMALLLACAGAAHGQEKTADETLVQKSGRFWQSYGVPADRLFFPRHWIRGYTEFEGLRRRMNRTWGAARRCGPANSAA